MKPIIEVKKLSKKYKIGKLQSYRTLRDTITNALKHPFGLYRDKERDINGLDKNDFWALKDVSFTVNKGEVLGIIGKNGAGKSTLLKVLSRITPPTNGEIVMRGRVASLLEVGTGFNGELTGRENIFLNGAILGMSQNEIRKKFDEIIDFAEIEKFLDTPVKRYSSGMYMRLAFAVAAHLEPEILIIDEVLAVGDNAFQEKCLGKMEMVAKQGRTVLFVSHNMSAIRHLCQRAILLENGKIIFKDTAVKVVNKYINNLTDNSISNAEIYYKEDLKKEFQIISIKTLNEQRKINQNFSCDSPILIELVCISRKNIPSLYGYMNIINKEGNTILISDTLDIKPNYLDNLHPGKYRILIKIPKRLLGHGKYILYFNFTSNQGTINFNIDSPEYACSFSLYDNTTERGNKRDGFFSTLLKWEVTPV